MYFLYLDRELVAQSTEFSEIIVIVHHEIFNNSVNFQSWVLDCCDGLLKHHVWHKEYWGALIEVYYGQ